MMSKYNTPGKKGLPTLFQCPLKGALSVPFHRIKSSYLLLGDYVVRAIVEH